MRVLGADAVFHDPAAALVVDGRVVAAAEEERFSPREHGKRPVPCSTWELPELAIPSCLEQAGLAITDIDLVGCSYDPRPVLPSSELDLGDPDDAIRTDCARRAPEALTRHLGFPHSSDEPEVMALTSCGKPRPADEIAEFVHATGDGGFVARSPDWTRWAPRLLDGEQWDPRRDTDHADLAASVQEALERTLVHLATWLHAQTGDRVLTMAGGTALNCVANSRIWRESPFEEVFVQPAAGDSGTALGAALQVSADEGELVAPLTTAALGRPYDDDELAGWSQRARVLCTTPADLAGEVADVLAADGVVAWFQGREQFRPVAPMVLAERAEEVFSDGPFPSPYMLFVHDVRPEWRERIPAVTHVDGTARIQTVDDERTPQVAALLRAFEECTGLPVVVNTSLNTAGRPVVEDPRDALELFGSAPVDVLVLGPHLVRRAALVQDGA